MSSSVNLTNAINSFTSSHAIPTCGYIDNEEFLVQHRQFLDIAQNNFSVFHMNIRSLNANKDKLVLLLSTLKDPFDVIVLSEIWVFNLNFYANLFPNHNFYFSLPDSSTVGGIGAYVHKSFSVTIHTLPIPNHLSLDCETLVLEISKNKKTSVISGFYRHPSPSISNFNEFIEFLMLGFF